MQMLGHFFIYTVPCVLKAVGLVQLCLGIQLWEGTAHPSEGKEMLMDGTGT